MVVDTEQRYLPGIAANRDLARALRRLTAVRSIAAAHQNGVGGTVRDMVDAFRRIVSLVDGDVK